MNHSLPIIRFAVIFALAALTAGCADLMKISDMSKEIASGDPYPQDDPTKDVKLVPLEADSMSMGIPEGWTRKPAATDDTLKMMFENGKGATLSILCFGAFVHRNTLQEILQNAVKKALPNATKVAGMNELEVSGLNPRFELYRGSKTVGKVEVSLDTNIAWRVNDRFSGCKYGLIYIAPSSDGKQNEYEFLSIVRSLK